MTLGPVNITTKQLLNHTARRTKLASGVPDPTKYHPSPDIPDATILPDTGAEGRLPGFDASKGLELFRVIDITEDENGREQHVEHLPGELDSLGNKKAKEAECPSTSQPTGSPAQASPLAEASGSPGLPPPTSLPPSPAAEAPRKAKKGSAIDSERVLQLLSAQQTTLSSLCSQLNTLLSRVASVEAALASFTSKSPLPVLEEAKPKKFRPQINLTFDGPFGQFHVSAVAVENRDGATLLIIYDPSTPYFVPAAGDMQLRVEYRPPGSDTDVLLDVRPVGWSSPFTWDGHEYLMTILPIVHDAD